VALVSVPETFFRIDRSFSDNAIGYARKQSQEMPVKTPYLPALPRAGTATPGPVALTPDCASIISFRLLQKDKKTT
jgi:hypothetical protein